MVVVEVRQKTLDLEGRGGAPTENNVLRGSRLRRGGEEKRRGEEKATDIKANNPHLAGTTTPPPPSL